MSFKFNLKKKANGKFAVRMRSYELEVRIAAGMEHYDYVERILPENEWYRHGFDVSMTYEEASAKVKTLNSVSKAEDIKERKARYRYLEAKEKKELLQSAYLPDQIVSEFEKRLENDSYATDYRKSKSYYHWKTALRVIADIDIPPHEWADHKRQIIKKMEGYALSTVSKLISLLNQYGNFYCMKVGKFYQKLTMPKGIEVGRMSDKYLDRTGGRTKEAKGVSLAMMNTLKNTDELSREEIDWCVVCLGFGLRPVEVKYVTEGDPKKFIVLKSSVKVYQSKQVSLPRHLRFKEVRLKHPFQLEALDIVNAGKPISSPSLHRLRKVLGNEYGLYSFRKGYEDIMASLGEGIERIAADLGHSSIERTWKSYRKRISLSDD